jgi:hypothetical protein
VDNTKGTLTVYSNGWYQGTTLALQGDFPTALTFDGLGGGDAEPEAFEVTGFGNTATHNVPFDEVTWAWSVADLYVSGSSDKSNIAKVTLTVDPAAATNDARRILSLDNSATGHGFDGDGSEIIHLNLEGEYDSVTVNTVIQVPIQDSATEFFAADTNIIVNDTGAVTTPITPGAAGTISLGTGITWTTNGLTFGEITNATTFDPGDGYAWTINGGTIDGGVALLSGTTNPALTVTNASAFPYNGGADYSVGLTVKVGSITNTTVTDAFKFKSNGWHSGLTLSLTDNATSVIDHTATTPDVDLDLSLTIPNTTSVIESTLTSLAWTVTGVTPNNTNGGSGGVPTVSDVTVTPGANDLEPNVLLDDATMWDGDEDSDGNSAGHPVGGTITLTLTATYNTVAVTTTHTVTVN